MKATRLNRGLFWLILLALLLALVLPSDGTGVAQASPDPGWYSSNWTYRKKVTFTSDFNKIPSTQSYFPVLISLSSDSDLATDAQDDGDDILFTSSDGTTQLDHEIEKFDGGTGELVAWVEVPSLSTGTVIYMYYGNGTCGSQQDVEHTWDEGTDASPANNYKMVQHLQEASLNGSAGEVVDSTVNDNDGKGQPVNGGYNGPTPGATGQINSAFDFDGTGDYIDTSLTLPGGANPFTVSLWFDWPDNVTDLKGDIVLQCVAEKDGVFAFVFEESKSKLKYAVYYYDTARGRWDKKEIMVEGLTLGEWHHAVGCWNGTNSTLYVDGSFVGTLAVGAALGTGDNVEFGTNKIKGYFKGILDEVRISDTARSADWIETSYNNQSDPTAFCSVGEEESRFVTAIEIRAQDYTTPVSAITFPEAAPGATVSNPSNDHVGDVAQTFGAAGTAKPVVTLVNTASVAYTIWYNITPFTNEVVSEEYYLIVAKGGEVADEEAITNAVTFHATTPYTTNITIDAIEDDPANQRDLYLKITLSAVAGKTGTSTLTILGEST